MTDRLKEIESRLESFYAERTLGRPEFVLHAVDDIRYLLEMVRSQGENHCTDCCCAKSWEALGITEYTGKSIPEHIELLRADNTRLHAALEKLILVIEDDDLWTNDTAINDARDALEGE